MLLDSGHIQERDAEYVNKQNAKRGKPLVEPIYTQQDAEDCIDSFVSHSYNRSSEITPGVHLTFIDAGHMLGSASVLLDIEDQAAKRNVRLVFSGDIGRVGIPIIRDPQMVDAADFLIMESTYGDRLHEPYGDSTQALERIINETYRQRGKIIIPSFAVGRTQQLVYSIHQLVLKGSIPRLPVYVDSPLAGDATGVYRAHPECYDSEIRQFVMQIGGKADPFGFNDLNYTQSVDDSKALNDMDEPMIIISASGMAETGRILHHLKNNIENPRTTVLIVGWQAPNTLGRRLVEKAKSVRIFGEEYRNNARVEVLNGFSGHADSEELLAWYGAMGRKPSRTFLVHGEPEPAFALANSLKTRYNAVVDVPEWKQSFEV
jgi:metallo-beta-lactamase family protein